VREVYIFIFHACIYREVGDKMHHMSFWMIGCLVTQINFEEFKQTCMMLFRERVVLVINRMWIHREGYPGRAQRPMAQTNGNTGQRVSHSATVQLYCLEFARFWQTSTSCINIIISLPRRHCRYWPLGLISPPCPFCTTHIALTAHINRQIVTTILPYQCCVGSSISEHNIRRIFINFAKCQNLILFWSSK